MTDDNELKEAFVELVADIRRDPLYGLARVNDEAWDEFRRALNAYIERRVADMLPSEATDGTDI